MVAAVPVWRDRVSARIDGTDIPRRVDVAVIGGGIIGLAAMVQLIADGASTVLIEAGRPGAGASTTGSGVVGWSRTLADPTEIDPRASGHAGLAETLDGAQDWFSQWVDTGGYEVGLTDPGAVRITGPIDPGDLGTLDPQRLVDALAHDVLGAGGSCATDEPLRSLSRHTTGFQLLTSRRKISARSVIVATGAHPGPFPLGELAKRYHTRSGRCVVVRPDPQLIDRIVPDGATHHIFGPQVTVARRVGADHILVWFPDAARRAAARSGAALVADVIPELAGASVTHDWPDRYAAAHDGLPRIGRIDAAWYVGGAADPALGALLGYHVAGLVTGTVARSPFAEIPHPRRSRRGRAAVLPLRRNERGPRPPGDR